MSGLNVDRMRRYVARTTPSTLRFVVDVTVDDAQPEAEAIVSHWRRRMAVKHPGRRTTLTVWPDGMTWQHHIEGRVDSA